ncbi:MAG: ZIP family metal transporter [Oscillospiraceae bacterium]|jgi:ZIP family zinc transporter|nr:ZIP family metal transporter [Oscillospiraceae bacterium]
MYIIFAALAGIFTFVLNCLGGLFGVISKKRRDLTYCLAISGGIMLAAAIFSLARPAIEAGGLRTFLPWSLFGIAFMAAVNFFADRQLQKSIHGFSGNPRRIALLIIAITLHNIPEGFAIGAAFGRAQPGAMLAAIALAVGIGIQDFPEGTAVSLPLYSSGWEKKKAFWVSVLAGAVEPVAALVGAVAEHGHPGSAVLPVALSISAGAMLFVVSKEIVLPDIIKGNRKKAAIIAFSIGFAVMTTLDIALS